MSTVIVVSGQRQALKEREPLTFDSPLRSETVHAQASPEEWPTEVWQTQVQERLNELFDDPPNVPGWLSSSINLTRLRPSLAQTYRNGDLSVYRPESGRADEDFQGREAWALHFRELLAPFGDQRPDVHVKIVDVRPDPTADSFSARVLLELDAVAAPWIQQRIEWETRWTRSIELQKIKLRFFEEVRWGQRLRWFRDRTADVFTNEPAFTRQLAFGIDDWRGRLESGLAPTITGFFGLALGDADGDGRDDLFLCQPHGLPNRLFLQKADGSVVESEDNAVLKLLDATSSALFLDTDNDGDQDLIVAGDGFFIYHVNDGEGR